MLIQLECCYYTILMLIEQVYSCDIVFMLKELEYYCYTVLVLIELGYCHYTVHMRSWRIAATLYSTSIELDTVVFQAKDLLQWFIRIDIISVGLIFCTCSVA